MHALGYKREDLSNRTIPFSGDYLTIRNIRFSNFCEPEVANLGRIAIAQLESIPRDHLDHFEPFAGMFHLRMAVLNDKAGAILPVHFLHHLHRQTAIGPSTSSDSSLATLPDPNQSPDPNANPNPSAKRN
jgi:hypothetical protein